MVLLQTAIKTRAKQGKKQKTWLFINQENTGRPLKMET